MLHVYTQRSCVCTHRTPFAYKARRSCVYTYIDHRCTYRGLVYPQTTLQKNLPKKCIFTQNLLFCTQIDGTCTQILGTWVLSYTNSTTKKALYTKKAHIHKNCSCVYNSELESASLCSAPYCPPASSPPPRQRPRHLVASSPPHHFLAASLPLRHQILATSLPPCCLRAAFRTTSSPPPRNLLATFSKPPRNLLAASSPHPRHHFLAGLAATALRPCCLPAASSPRLLTSSTSSQPPRCLASRLRASPSRLLASSPPCLLASSPPCLLASSAWRLLASSQPPRSLLASSLSPHLAATA